MRPVTAEGGWRAKDAPPPDLAKLIAEVRHKNLKVIQEKLQERSTERNCVYGE